MRFRTSLFVAAVSVPAFAGASVIDTTPGLAYHLSADTGIGTDTSGNVNTWSDANANGIVFTAPTTGTTTTSKDATFTANNPLFNNLPTVNFNGDVSGATLGVAPNASSLIENQSSTAQTVFIVESVSTTNFLAGIWGQNQGDNGIRRNSSTKWQYNGPGGGGNANDFPNSLTIDAQPTATQGLGTAGLLTATGNSTFTANIGDYFFAGTGNAPRSFGGDIAEIAVYNTALTPDQINAIDQYLNLKYNTPEPTSLSLVGFASIGLLRAAVARRSESSLKVRSDNSQLRSPGGGAGAVDSAF